MIGDCPCNLPALPVFLQQLLGLPSNTTSWLVFNLQYSMSAPLPLKDVGPGFMGLSLLLLVILLTIFMATMISFNRD
jgi:hypothetical protein